MFKRITLFSLILSVFLTFGADVHADPFRSSPEFNLSSELMRKSPAEYERRILEMRTELQGDIPHLFTFDGVEYSGNFVAKGSNTEIYRIIESGKTFLLRVPHSLRGIFSGLTYQKGILNALKAKFPVVKIYGAITKESNVLKVEDMKGFKNLSEIFQDAAAHPHDPLVQRQLALLDAFVVKYGDLRCSSYSAEKAGVGYDSSGKLAFRVLDVESAEPTSFTRARVYAETPIADILQRAVYNFSSNKYVPPTDISLEEFQRNAADLLASRNKLYHSLLYPAEVRDEKVRAPAMVLKSAGPNLEKVWFFDTSVALVALDPRLSPFGDADEKLGLACEKAYLQKDRAVCDWDFKLSPLNNVVYCSVIRKAHPTKVSSKVCTIEYDSFAFRIDDPTSREKFRVMGFFGVNGAKVPDADTAEYFADLRKQLTVTEPIYKSGIRFPGLPADPHLQFSEL